MDKKFLIVLVALVLSVTCTIGVTLAWLIDESNVVTNTFTVGNIEITLDEAKVDVNGKATTDRVTENTYKVIPGNSVDKDPTVTVAEKSENCWVYVKVVNQLVLERTVDNSTVKTVVATYNVDTTNWTLVGTSTDANGVVTNLYRYKAFVPYSTSETVLPDVFTKVTYDSSIEIGEISALKDKKIIVTAYAHQYDTVAETEVNATACTWAGVTAVSTNG